MKKDKKHIVESIKDQGIAAWIDRFNQIRFETLLEDLKNCDGRLNESLSQLEKINQFISNPESILGSNATKHGEIAEWCQVFISNARDAIKGNTMKHSFDGVGRTAPEDYLRDGMPVQSKFYNGLKNTIFSKGGIKDHLEKYNFIKEGGAYDIPSDQYEKLEKLWDLYKNSPSKLSKHDYALAKKIDEFLMTNNIKIGKDIKGAVIDYNQAQMGAANKTLSDEKKYIKKKNDENIENAYNKAKPTLNEGLKAFKGAATTEGAISFLLAFVEKRKGKTLDKFTAKDWEDILKKTRKGAIKGGARGGAIYTLTNFTATPASMATAYVTAFFGVGAQLIALEKGEISKERFMINCEALSLDVSVSAISALLGQAVIPVPILGALVGTVAGEFMYMVGKEMGAKNSLELAAGYNKEMECLKQQLCIEYLNVIVEIERALRRFLELEKLAFDTDVAIAFRNSIELAVELGVDKNKILKTKTERDNFFLS